MSCSLEAFAVALDDPAEVYHGARGERVPFGFELEWETDRAGYLWPPITPRYEIPCRVHGEVLVGDRRIEVDGWGQRDHSWGAARDWWAMSWNWTAGRLDDGTRWHTAGALHRPRRHGRGVHPPRRERRVRAARRDPRRRHRRPGGARSTRARCASATSSSRSSRWRGHRCCSTHPDGREDRFPRALARVRAADGRSGLGWVEWNQPLDPTPTFLPNPTGGSVAQKVAGDRRVSRPCAGRCDGGWRTSP